MIHAPTLKPNKLITLIYSGDPALSLPADPAEREKALEVARDEGGWAQLVAVGATPTLFHVKIPTGTAWNYLIGEIARRQMVGIEAAAFALRVALEKVENFGAHRVVRIVDPSHDETIATKDIINAIYEEAGPYGRDIVEELGAHIIAKGKERLSPK